MTGPPSGEFTVPAYVAVVGLGRHWDTWGVSTVSVPVEVTPDIDEQVEEFAETQPPWITLVWNDPVNLMSYVTYVFMNYFKYSREKAEKLMSDVHHEGRAVVSSGTREEMERHVTAMHSYGLWATLQKDR
jgi:ATP-dependent Clp protease adaptor protein ClpS